MYLLKKSTYKWTHTVQACIVQGSTVIVLISQGKKLKLHEIHEILVMTRT